jgi:hypothetical protein
MKPGILWLTFSYIESTVGEVERWVMYEDRGFDRPQVQPSIQQNGAIESSVLLPRLEEKAASSLLKSFFYLWEVLRS